jgi:hypothetical protein
MHFRTTHMPQRQVFEADSGSGSEKENVRPRKRLLADFSPGQHEAHDACAGKKESAGFVSHRHLPGLIGRARRAAASLPYAQALLQGARELGNSSFEEAHLAGKMLALDTARNQLDAELQRVGARPADVEAVRFRIRQPLHEGAQQPTTA